MPYNNKITKVEIHGVTGILTEIADANTPGYAKKAYFLNKKITEALRTLECAMEDGRELIDDWEYAPRPTAQFYCNGEEKV